uniref:Cysteine-rich PDZ-binding protein n=1 Tax=Globisporangium ultimum (strain ATCC 200006 / CBS 805.95 / DAOM BR144) TaxID=431595 RepID=K3X4G6_GLOUD
MVCDKCEEKLSKLVVPDKWTDGARNTTGGKDGGRKVGGNRLLKKRAERFTPMERKCRICKCKAGQHCHYCNQCAYKKGICAMCGRKVLDTKEFNMSS